jgi:hypothetical protein
LTQHRHPDSNYHYYSHFPQPFLKKEGTSRSGPSKTILSGRIGRHNCGGKGVAGGGGLGQLPNTP